ncbi:MAG: PepSY-associated TM helix domain-containing protein [Mariniphaga sp.]
MARSPFKTTIIKIHQWLGLSSGLLVFLISISGAMYAFKDEIYNAVYAQDMHVSEPSGSRLPLDSLMNIVQTDLGNEHPVNYVNAYKDPDRAWRFKAYKYNPEKVSYFSWCEYDYVVYANPYTGEIQRKINHKYEFFQLVKMFHWSFWLRTDIGQPIVGWTVVLFVLCLITGVIWWWPRRSKFSKRKFTIRWRGVSMVIFRDWHVVTGIFSFPIILLLALTGMVWAFKWFMALVYIVANLSTQSPATAEEPSATSGDQMPQVYETIYQNTRSYHPDAYNIFIYQLDKQENTVAAYVKNRPGVYYDSTRETYDASTGDRLSKKSFEELTSGEKVVSMNYDIHTGAVLGIWGKIIAFIGALISAGLPVTGFVVWLKRHRRHLKGSP